MRLLVRGGAPVSYKDIEGGPGRCLDVSRNKMSDTTKEDCIESGKWNRYQAEECCDYSLAAFKPIGRLLRFSYISEKD